MLCIYHSIDGNTQHCDDGFASAYIVNQALEGDVDFYPGIYGQNPPDVKNQDVLLVDFSYKRPVLEKMLEQCKSMVVLDHHASAERELSGIDDQKAEIHFDMNKSGATLTWDYFYGTEPPMFFQYVEDRDLFRHRLPNVHDFSWGLRSYPQNFGTWENLINQGADQLIREGQHIKRFVDKKCSDLAENAIKIKMANYTVPAVNAPHFIASELAGHIAENAPFGAVYSILPDGKFLFSLRSRENGVDVSRVAEKFGGGGHPGAAGCTLSQDSEVIRQILGN